MHFGSRLMRNFWTGEREWSVPGPTSTRTRLNVTRTFRPSRTVSTPLPVSSILSSVLNGWWVCNSRIFNLSGSFGKFSAAVNILIFRKEIYTEFKISNDEGKKWHLKLFLKAIMTFYVNVALVRICSCWAADNLKI